MFWSVSGNGVHSTASSQFMLFFRYSPGEVKAISSRSGFGVTDVHVRGGFLLYDLLRAGCNRLQSVGGVFCFWLVAGLATRS